jgi:hypothetical protein
MPVTTNYNWNIGIKGQKPWFADVWNPLLASLDTELYKRSKDLFMQNNKIYGSENSGGDLKLYSTSHATKGKIYLGESGYGVITYWEDVGFEFFGGGATLKIAGRQTDTYMSLGNYGYGWLIDLVPESNASAVICQFNVPLPYAQVPISVHIQTPG